MNNKNDMYDVIIVGAGCAGLTAGIYAGRAKLKTLIIEKLAAGGQAATTNEVENYPGFQKISGPMLMEKMLLQAKNFNCEFLQSKVTDIVLSSNIKEVITEKETFTTKAIILATGANPKKLGFEGEEEYKGRGVGYCATCDGFFFEGKDIFVIGGGYSAAEEALYLTRFGKKVTVIVRKDKFNCAQTIIDEVMSNNKIEVKFNTEIIKVYGEDFMQGAVFKNNVTNEIYEYKLDEKDEIFGVFVFVGYEPDTAMFKDKIKLNEKGYVLADEKMKTNIEGVFAAGDLREKTLRQIVTATADGAIAATEAEKYIKSLK